MTGTYVKVPLTNSNELREAESIKVNQKRLVGYYFKTNRGK